MLGKSAGLLVALAWAVAARAQTVTLRFDGPGSREAWISASPPEAEPTTKVSSDQAKLTLPLPAENPKNRVYVHDRKTGLLAVLPVPAQPITVGGKFFTHVYRTLVSVEHGGKPVAAGLVTVDDGERKQAQFLAPGDKGRVAFYGLRLGHIKVDIQYKSGEAKRTTPSQTFEVAADPERPEPILTISIPDEVAVVETEQAREVKPSSPAEKVSSSPSIVGTLVVMLFGIAAVVGLFWAFFHFAKKNPDALKSNLERLGVQVPGSGDQADDAVPIAVPPSPAPVEPIILDPATPAPTSATTSLAREPALVDATGRRLSLAEGVNVVGRDDGLEVSIGGESTVSRRHAEIVRTDGSLMVRDLGSTNGTFVNGVRIESDSPLSLGDTVQFGAVRFKVEA